MRRTATVPLDPLGLRWKAYIHSIGKLCAKYQFCTIHTADNTDGKVTKSELTEVEIWLRYIVEKREDY